jgi:hypothetical protein
MSCPAMVYKIFITIRFPANDKNDPCILCQGRTPYCRSTPIKERMNFVRGLGQVCDECAANPKYRIAHFTEE